MTALFAAFERASLFGLAALIVALSAQVILDGRVPASWRVWIWRVALIQTTLALLLALLPLTPIRLAVLPPRPSVVEPIRPLTEIGLPPFSSPNEDAEAASMGIPTVETAPLGAPSSATQVARSLSVGPCLAALYALGLSVQLLLLVCCFGRVRASLRACQPVEEATAHDQLRQIARKMQVSPLPRLIASERGAPCLIGLLRPIIVVPRALIESQNGDLAAVLSHELSHLKRRDLVWNALLWLAQSLLWFHPLTWISRRFLSLETESACDEMVLSSTHISPKSYGALLLNTMKTPQTPLTAGVADGFGALKTRLVRLNLAPKHPRRAAKLAFAAVFCIAIGTSLPLRLVARAQDETSGPKTRPVTQTSTKVSDAAQGVIAKTGIVSGRVFSPTNQPLAKAHVSWVSYRDGTSVGAVLSTVTTDSRGRFRFADSPSLLARSLSFSGTFMETSPPQLLVEASGSGASSAPVLAPKPAPVTVRLAPATALEATFVDRNGQVVPRLRVRVSILSWGEPDKSSPPWRYLLVPRDAKSFVALTDASGVCRFTGLPQGAKVRLEVDDERFAQLGYENGDIKLGTTARTQGTPIQLAVGASARGRITYRDSGLPVAGVGVGAQGVDPRSTWGETLSDRNGYYEIKNLGAGSYNIALSLKAPLSDDWTAQAHEKVVVASGDRLENLDFELEPGALITGRVTAQGSTQPVPGLQIGIYGPAHPRSGAWVQMAGTAADGTYRLRVPSGQQLIYIMSQPPAGFSAAQSAPQASVPITPSGAYSNKTYELTLSDGQSATVDWQLPKIKKPAPVGRVGKTR